LTSISNEKKGMHSLLKFSTVYNIVQNILGSRRAREIFINEYIKPRRNSKILDFGSGTGALFEEIKNIPGLKYFGIEPNNKYVIDCKLNNESFQNAIFFSGSIEVLESIDEKFDTIVVAAVLHHLKTEYWSEILEKLYSKLAVGGKIVLVDIVFHENQHFISKLLVSLDRGVSVLKEHDYLRLIKGEYKMGYDLRTDLMRVPYSHIISTIYKA